MKKILAAFLVLALIAGESFAQGVPIKSGAGSSLGTVDSSTLALRTSPRPLGVRCTMPATGTWNAQISVEWSEIVASGSGF